MRTITVTVEVTWPKGKLSLATLERAVHRSAMAAGRKALVDAMGAWEQELLPHAGARQRRVRRYLLTRLGPIRQLDRVRAEMFNQGLAPPEAAPVDMVVAEVDGVVLRRQGGGVMEAEVCAAYTGKRPVSETARHRRRLCTGKVLLAGFYDEHTGPTLYANLCRSVGIHRARHTLVPGDGAEWIPVMVRGWFPEAVFQLDHYHLKHRLRIAAAGDADLAGRWISWALQGRWRSVARSMTNLVARGRLEPKLATETLAFLELNHSAIWAFRRLEARGTPRELCTRGSGVVEHNIDLLACRRMKRQGMRWSRRGAHHMLALRCLLLDPPAWRAWWKEVVG